MRKTLLLILLLCIGWHLSAEEKIKIGILTDIHVVGGNQHEKALYQVIEQLNQEDLDFVVIIGDLTNTGSDQELENVKRILSSIRWKTFVLPGNHETTWSESGGLKFKELWSDDKFVHSMGSYDFIGFASGPYMRMAEGIVKAEDVTWLHQQICSSRQKGRTVISFCHIPLCNGMGNGEEIASMLRKGNCPVVFCGHGHHYKEEDCKGVTSIMCRATYLRKDSTQAGYTILSLTEKDLVVRERIVKGESKEIYRLSLAAIKAKAASKKYEEAELVRQKQTQGRITIEKVCEDASSIFTGLAVGRQHLYYGTSAGEIKAMDIKTGKQEWSYPTGAPLYSTPVLYKDHLLIGTTKGEILCLDPHSGQYKWSIPTPCPIMSEGIEEDGYLYIGGTGAFYKIDIHHQKIIWTFDQQVGRTQARPLIKNNKVIFPCWQYYLHALDIDTGKELWRWSNGRNVSLLSPGNCRPFYAQEKVFIAAPDRYMTAIDIESGKQIWRNNSFKYRESIGGIEDDTLVYAKTMDGELVALSTTSNTFKKIWIEDMKIGYEHNPCPITVFKGIAFNGSRLGKIATVEIAKRKTAAVFNIGHSTPISFTKHHDALYIPLIEGTVWKITVAKGEK